MRSVHVRLLDAFAVTVDGAPAPRDGWGRRNAAALVKLLALAPGHRLHREQVADALWPEASVDRAIPRLHKAAFYARQAVPGAVVLRGEMVSLFPDDRLVVDVDEFEALGKAALATNDRGSLARALQLAGALLPEDRYEGWVERRADALRIRHLELLHLAHRWNDILELDPADEIAHLALARQHRDDGNRHAALRQLQRLERALSDLGLAMSTDAIQLRLQVAADGAARSPSPHHPGRGRESKHRFEHRRRATPAAGRHRATTHGHLALAASCRAPTTCC